MEKIPCGDNISLGWTCNEGHLCDKCHFKKEVIDRFKGRRYIRKEEILQIIDSHFN